MPGRDGRDVHGRHAGRPPHGSASRCSAGTRSTPRSPRSPSGWRRGVDLGRDRRAAGGPCRACPGRLNPLPGLRGSLILDDSYSSSPAAAEAALETLAALEGRRKIAVLGDMVELGDFEAAGHEQVGRRAAEVVDLLVTRGNRARRIAEAAREAGLPGRPRRGDLHRGGCGEGRPGRSGAGRRRAGQGLAGHPHGAGRAAADGGARDVRKSAWCARMRPGSRLSRLFPDRPTWLEIDHGAIAHNVRRLVELAGGRQLLISLKADAYGHGAVQVAQTALLNGASWLGVATLERGRGAAPGRHRRARPGPGLHAGLAGARRAPPRPDANRLQPRGRRARSHAPRLRWTGRRASTSRSTRAWAAWASSPRRRSTSSAAWPACPESSSRASSRTSPSPTAGPSGSRRTPQSSCESSTEVLAALQNRRISKSRSSTASTPPGCSTQRSAFWPAITRSARHTLVRAGIAVYGLHPSPGVRLPADFRPALSWKTQVAQVKTLPPGSYVSYGATYKTAGAQTDRGDPGGLRGRVPPRSPQNWGEVLVRGRRAPIVGRVTMDQTMIDVTGIPGVRQGDEVVLIGQQGERRDHRRRGRRAIGHDQLRSCVRHPGPRAERDTG